MSEHPKVFLSYSHDSQEHKDWVLKLATDLRQHHGVDIVFDQWDMRIGGDLARYMEQGLSNAVLVLCVCSDLYVDKSNSGIGGSGYEKMIISSSLIKNCNIDCIIPIVRSNSKQKKMPTFLGTKLYIDFSTDSDYTSKLFELSARIWGEDIAKKPPLGDNPFSKNKSDFIILKDTTVRANYHNPLMNGIVVFDYSNNDHKYTIGSGDYEFNTAWTSCGCDCIYAYNDFTRQLGYASKFTNFPTFEELCEFDYTSRVRRVYINEVVVWVNHSGKIAVTKVLSVKAKSHGADKDELSFEYKIYPMNLS